MFRAGSSPRHKALALMMFQCGRTNTTPKSFCLPNLWSSPVVARIFIEPESEINYRNGNEKLSESKGERRKRVNDLN
jgi:hypothetical protein